MYTGKGTKTFSDITKNKIFILCAISIILIGCKGITEVDGTKSVKRDAQTFAGTNQAMVYTDSPAVLAGATNFNSPDLEDVLSVGFITENNYLEKNCLFTQYTSSTSAFTDTTSDSCFLVLNDTSTSTQAIQSMNQSWNFNIYSDEFYQVNLFYHINQIQSRFFDTLSFVHKQVHHNSNMSIPPATKYNLTDTKSYWITDNGVTNTLKAYSKCYLSTLNAYYSPSEDIICMGYNDTFSNFNMTQDPTIIYHEFAHLLVKSLMNQRNVTAGLDSFGFYYFNAHPFHSDLGTVFYDEAGAINEGIADFFSYYMNGRDKFGQWGLGAAYAEAYGDNKTGRYRPMSENDSAHTADVSETSGERLIYPQFLHYDPNIPDANIEDIHNAGMIISHYLVALTKELKSQCSFGTTDSDVIHKKASDYVMLLISETLAEIGDLTAKGSDMFSEYAPFISYSTFDQMYFVNLNEDESYLWTQVVNPPNMRRFFRIFGKNLYHHISSNLCSEFSIDESEQLMDDYGLLLFTSYEDAGNGWDLSDDSGELYSFHNGNQLFSNGLAASFVNTTVNETNRKNSVLISKELIQLDEDAVAYVFDGQNDIKNVLANLTFEGQNVTTTEGIAGTEYNNNNVKISPGEVVGISLNIFNNSNSTMAGVQVLANDWDHMKIVDPDGNNGILPYNYVNRDINVMAVGNLFSGYKATHAPCIIDDFPTQTQGGVTDTSTTTPGNCARISRDNSKFDLTHTSGSDVYPKHELDAPQPICLVEYNDTNESRWVSQEYFRTNQMTLEDKDCLNNPSMSGNEFNPNECLIRVLPGAEQAILGKINAQSTWAETIQADTNQDVEFNSSNIFLIEVNKWIPPGTRFNCRARVRFTNCIDCYNDESGNEYKDFEYAGHEPYKVIDFQFTVND